MFGVEKFTDPQWIKFFQQVGWGHWFRYFTGAVELLGGAMLLIPSTVTGGLTLLVCTMGAATLIWVFIVGPAANGIITGFFCVGLMLFWLNRRSG